MAYLQARWQISVMSAPEKPLVCFTSRSSCAAGHSHVSTSKGIRVSVRISCRSCHVRMQALPCHALLWPTGLQLRPAGLLPGQQGCLLTSKRPHLDIGGDGALAGHRAEDLAPAALVRQRDVDELVQPAWPQQGWVDDVRPAKTCKTTSVPTLQLRTQPLSTCCCICTASAATSWQLDWAVGAVVRFQQGRRAGGGGGSGTCWWRR